MLVAVALLCAGCARRELIGTWEGNLTAGESGQVVTSLQFQQDGTIVQRTKVPLGELVLRGSYSVDGDDLRITYTTATIGDRSVLDTLSKSQKDSLDQISGFRVKGDSLVLVHYNQSLPFTRVR
jgi:hypothetical protein